MNERKKGWLTKLDVEEVSLVPAGAAQGSRKLFSKSDDTTPSLLSRTWDAFKKLFVHDDVALGVAATPPPATDDSPRTVAQLMSAHEFWEEWVELREALEQSICEIMASDTADKPALLKQTVTEFLEALEDKLGDTEADDAEVEKIDAALAATLAELPKTTTPDDVKKALDALEQSAGKPTGPQPPAEPQQETIIMAKTAKEVLDGMAPEDKDTLEKFYAEKYGNGVTKAAPAPAPEVPAEIRKMLDDAEAKRIALEKALADEREIRVIKEITAEVQGYNLPGMDVAKAVSVIKSAQQGKPVDVTDLRSMFAATTEVVKAHNLMLKQMGSPVGMDAAERPAASEVNRLAKAWLDQHTEVRGTADARMAAAKAAVYESNPQLMSAEMAEG